MGQTRRLPPPRMTQPAPSPAARRFQPRCRRTNARRRNALTARAAGATLADDWLTNDEMVRPMANLMCHGDLPAKDRGGRVYSWGPERYAPMWAARLCVSLPPPHSPQRLTSVRRLPATNSRRQAEGLSPGKTEQRPISRPNRRTRHGPAARAGAAAWAPREVWMKTRRAMEGCSKADS